MHFPYSILAMQPLPNLLSDFLCFFKLVVFLCNVKPAGVLTDAARRCSCTYFKRETNLQ